VKVCAPFKDANRSDYRQARIEGETGSGEGGGKREEMTVGWTLLMNGTRAHGRGRRLPV